MEEQIKIKAKELAERICSFTGYGQALHINDILPDLLSFYDSLLQSQRDELVKEIEELEGEDDCGCNFTYGCQCSKEDGYKLAKDQIIFLFTEHDQQCEFFENRNECDCGLNKRLSSDL